MKKNTDQNEKRKLGNLKTFVVCVLLCICSLAAAVYYVEQGIHLPYADAMSRLNIARKVVDNLNPGIAQLGSVWLPLPQLLMLPFVWNEYLWHSGLAGTIMSMISYIVGGYFLYKAAYQISKSFFPSLLTLAVYALNINVLYLQTTAMSESIFMCLLEALLYFFLQWIDTNKRRYLVLGAMAVSGITLIRYEGLPLLLSSIALVFVYTIVKDRNYHRLEGNMIIYCTVACLGFALWTLYLTIIFGDPLFWIRYYAAAPTTTAGDSVAHQYSQAKPFMAAVWQYFTSVTWMSGIIPTVLAVIGLVLATAHSIAQRSWKILVLLMPLSIFLFMVLTLQRNTPIVQPNLTVANILSTTTSSQTGFNIRYGLMMFPWVALLSIYVFNLKKPWYLPSIFFFLLFGIQLTNTFKPTFTAVYEIPQSVYLKPDQDMVSWMREHYDGGHIMISASGFEDQMFNMGLPYRTYIHEGAGKYWTEALDRPARYADWVIVDFNRSSDKLASELKPKQYWSWDYNLVWEGESVRIYKIKTEPDLKIL